MRFQRKDLGLASESDGLKHEGKLASGGPRKVLSIRIIILSAGQKTILRKQRATTGVADGHKRGADGLD